MSELEAGRPITIANVVSALQMSPQAIHFQFKRTSRRHHVAARAFGPARSLQRTSSTRSTTTTSAGRPVAKLLVRAKPCLWYTTLASVPARHQRPRSVSSGNDRRPIHPAVCRQPVACVGRAAAAYLAVASPVDCGEACAAS